MSRNTLRTSPLLTPTPLATLRAFNKAHDFSDLQTPEQTTAIMWAANRRRINADKVSLARFGCRSNELSREGAAELIEFLNEQAL